MAQIEWATASQVLDEAIAYGMEVEVVVAAMEMLKEDPTMEISHALVLGAADWNIII